MQRKIKRSLLLCISALVSLMGIVGLGWPSLRQNQFHRHSVLFSQKEMKQNSPAQLPQTDKSTAEYLHIKDGVVKGLKLMNIPSELNLFIPSQTADGKVVKIDEKAFFKCTKIKTVEIEDGISEIAKFAFCSCSNLEKILIPASVTKIGEGILEKCDLLKSEDVINNSTVLFQWWVENYRYGQKTLRETELIDLNNYLNSAQKPFETIAEKAFADCWLPKHLVLPKSITYIANNAFSFFEPTRINRIKIEGDQLYLEKWALGGLNRYCDFYVNTTAMALKLRENLATRINVNYGDFYVKKIKQEVRLTTLTNHGRTNATLHVPINVNKIDAKAFEGCSNDLKTVIFECFDAEIAENALEVLPEDVQFEVFSKRMKNRLINQGINSVRIKLTNMKVKPDKKIKISLENDLRDTKTDAYKILAIVSSTLFGVLLVSFAISSYLIYRLKKTTKK